MLTKEQAKHWKILILDDEPDSLDVARKTMMFYGAEVLTASNGKQGLEVLKEHQPTFILSDLSMPEMDGWEFLHHVRENPVTKDIPIIALTAHAMKGDMERAIKVGFDSYLTKPLSPLSLLNDLLKVLSTIETRLVPVTLTTTPPLGETKHD